MSAALGGLLGLWLTGPLWGANVVLFCLVAFKLATRSDHGVQMHRILLCLIAFQISIVTVHVFSCIADLENGFIAHNGGFGPEDYFKKQDRALQTVQSVTYALSAWIGDSILTWRVYVLWDCRLDLVLPLIALNAVTVVCALTDAALISHLHSTLASVETVLVSISWATSFVVQCVGTLLIAWRAWSTPSVPSARSTHPSPWWMALWVFVESGALYCAATLAAIIVWYAASSMLDVLFAPLCQIAAFVPLTIILRECWKTEHSSPHEATFLIDERALPEHRRRRMLRHGPMAFNVNIQSMTHRHLDMVDVHQSVSIGMPSSSSKDEMDAKWPKR